MNQHETIIENLQHVDAETLTAFVRASASARFCCEAMVSPDSYARPETLSSTAKPESKAPGPHQLGWARKRVLSLLGSVASVEDALAAYMDRMRIQYDAGAASDRPTGVAGRPSTITQGHITEVTKLVTAGVSVTRIAHAGVLPARTFWGALRRGRDEITGPDHDLYIAVYGEGEK